MGITTDAFEQAGDVIEPHQEVEAFVSDVQGTIALSGGFNKDLINFLSYEKEKGFDVHFVSSNPHESEALLKQAPLPDNLKDLPVKEKFSTLRAFNRAGLVFVGIDDTEMLMEANGAAVTVNPTEKKARNYFASQAYKFAA